MNLTSTFRKWANATENWVRNRLFDLHLHGLKIRVSIDWFVMNDRHWDIHPDVVDCLKESLQGRYRYIWPEIGKTDGNFYFWIELPTWDDVMTFKLTLGTEGFFYPGKQK